MNLQYCLIIKGGNDIMYTFTMQVHIAKVYLIFLPPFIELMYVRYENSKTAAVLWVMCSS